MNTAKHLKQLTRNAIRCNFCGLVLESLHVHDYRAHECEKGPRYKRRQWIYDEDAPGGQRLVETEDVEGPWMMVDGGLEYARRGWRAGALGRREDVYTELSEYKDE